MLRVVVNRRCRFYCFCLGLTPGCRSNLEGGLVAEGGARRPSECCCSTFEQCNKSTFYHFYPSTRLEMNHFIFMAACVTGGFANPPAPKTHWFLVKKRNPFYGSNPGQVTRLMTSCGQLATLLHRTHDGING